ncbi:hypothetical protein [Xenorhabdus thailandensis]|uniref:hypothetical protein n=1 Tax=Xenorhabdus thailandensis TaxID=3136255 RepID=UPI0030F4929F
MARQNRITVMSLPALFWSELVARETHYRYRIASDSSSLAVRPLKRAPFRIGLRRNYHRPRLLNAYGPTENTVTATCKEILSRPMIVLSAGRLKIPAFICWTNMVNRCHWAALAKCILAAWGGTGLS